MKWQGGRRGGNVEDRRGLGPGAAAGGGLGVIVIALIGYFVFGIDPSQTQAVLGGSSQITGEQQAGVEGTPADEAGLFVDVIGANINDVWSGALPGYTEPTVVLYKQGTNTGCGYGQAAMGPFYCPADQTVYLDLSFWQEMETKLGASGADFARAYVIAHEFGHHLQTLTGASQQVQNAQKSARSREEANQYSIALELQADCYAGVWAARAADVSDGSVALERGDMEEGLKTAQAIGDDMIQKRMQGRVTPEAFTHGTAAQRMEWLGRGYNSGDPNQCDTFK
ncbi:neutral zinc metallopeptidase [Hyphomonas sp.]|uniref:KPN_02809 family neutral zinc metallopeptidase n=1 Tax=Hyphomonas sp. TaxID=87 RepID=UPI0025BC99CB|nr:neutral zinc metallopeptidase [Hyphomonas sp.]MBI1401240.1 flagellar biosynthesis protein FlgM [Hyphomonas sp.]